MNLKVYAIAVIGLIFSGCAAGKSMTAPGAQKSEVITLNDARVGFTTHLTSKKKTPDPVPKPPAGFELVHYKAPLGSFPAYLTTTKDRKVKHPAIVWIAGGFDNSIGDTPWSPARRDNDQSASAFPKAGIVTMYPSLRGGNNNPGYIEGLYGEVADAIAAANYLATRPEVDPKRIYLGGHSTGGTLALLIAETTPRFRAIFAFGPIDRIENYGGDNLPFDVKNKIETSVRSPLFFLRAIKTPTYVFEGTSKPSNLGPLHELASNCNNKNVRFYELPNLTHFSALAPITPVIAAGIIKDTGVKPKFSWHSRDYQIVLVDP